MKYKLYFRKNDNELNVYGSKYGVLIGKIFRYRNKICFDCITVLDSNEIKQILNKMNWLEEKDSRLN